MLALLESPDAKVSERLMILDRFRDLILLGGLQNPQLIDEIVRKTAPGFKLEQKEDKDPFSGKKPLKVVGVS